jgi:hypothetical protein
MPVVYMVLTPPLSLLICHLPSQHVDKCPQLVTYLDLRQHLLLCYNTADYQLCSCKWCFHNLPGACFFKHFHVITSASYITCSMTGQNVNVCLKILWVACQEKATLKAFNWYKNELSALIRTRVMRILVNQNARRFKETSNFKMQ